VLDEDGGVVGAAVTMDDDEFALPPELGAVTVSRMFLWL